MDLALVVALSAALQLAAAVVAVTLIPLTNRRLAWGFVALALLLMAVRRGLSLYYLLSGDATAVMDPLQEYIGLALSLFMLAGISMIRPIFTENRRAAAALSESESRFRAIADHTVDWESWFGPDGRYLWVSPSCLQITGYTDSEILAMPDFISTVVAEEDRAAFRGRFKRAIAGSIGHDFRFRFIRKDGEVRWLSASWQPIGDANGTPRGTRASGRDITEDMRAEEELRANEHLLGAIVDTTPTLIYVYDIVEGRNVYANREVSEFLGYTPEQIAAFGSDLFGRILNPEDAERVAQHHARMAEAIDTEVLEIEYRMKHSDGQWRWLRSRDTVFARDPHGTVTQILGSTEDVTERKRSEKALRESEERFRTMFEQSIVPHSMTTPDGEIHVNGALCELLGYTSEELRTGATWQQITHPQDVAKTDRYVAALLAGEIASARFEKRLIRKDGGIVWVDLSTSLLRDAEGRPRYFITTILDTTARKAAEENLLQQANTDELTGAANRRRFFESADTELKRAARSAEPLTVAFIDIDRLKNVNDAHGHAAGDKALIAFVQICARCIREVDLLARLGGDEFALLMPATTVEQADATIERIRTVLDETPVDVDDGRVALTVSVGIAGLSDEAGALDELMRRADRALYQAKQAGRDRAFIDISG